MKLYTILAQCIDAHLRCNDGKPGVNPEWLTRHKERADALAKEFLPSGSGIDTGTKINWDMSKPNRIVLDVPYHHTDENGFYDGWANYRVKVTASLAFGCDINVYGSEHKDSSSTRDYLGDLFHYNVGEQEIEKTAIEALWKKQGL